MSTGAAPSVAKRLAKKQPAPDSEPESAPQPKKAKQTLKQLSERTKLAIGHAVLDALQDAQQPILLVKHADDGDIQFLAYQPVSEEIGIVFMQTLMREFCADEVALNYLERSEPMKRHVKLMEALQFPDDEKSKKRLKKRFGVESVGVCHWVLAEEQDEGDDDDDQCIHNVERRHLGLYLPTFSCYWD